MKWVAVCGSLGPPADTNKPHAVRLPALLEGLTFPEGLWRPRAGTRLAVDGHPFSVLVCLMRAGQVLFGLSCDLVGG